MGIVKQSTPLLIGPTVPFEQSMKKAFEHNSPFFYSTQIRDTYELENEDLIRLGAKIVKPIFDYEAHIDEAVDFQVVSRFEKVPEEKLAERGSRVKNVHLDVGHNIDCIQRLFERVKREYGAEARVGVCFALKNKKPLDKIFECLVDSGARLWAMTSQKK